MKLDPKTIMLLIIIGSLLMSGGLLAVARGYLGQVHGVARWARATLVQACGWIITGALRGVLPDALSIVLGQALIVLSLALYLLILAQFMQYPVPRWQVFALVAAEPLLLAYFSLVQPDLALRIIIISACCAPLMFKSVQVLLARRSQRSASQLFTASLYILCGVFLVLRALFYIHAYPAQDASPFAQNALNDISYMVFYIFAVMLTFGFVLMCNERYVEQQKQSETALKTSHAMLMKLSAQVPGVIYQFQLFPDGHSCFPFASAGMQEMYGLTPEQVRLDATPTFAILHPDDVNLMVASIQESAASMQKWELEYRVRLPQQGVRWRRGHAQPEQLADGSILWHGFITDITAHALAQQKQRQLEAEVHAGFAALQASEARLRRLMNSSLIGIIQGDNSSKLLEANDVLLQMTGHSRAALQAGQLNWLEMTCEPCRKQQQAALAELRQYGSTAQFESVLQTADNAQLPIMLGMALLEGSQQEWVGFVLDLREQRRIDHMKAEFISVVSHELRTPLTSIRGSLGLLESGMVGVLPPQALQLIKIAHKNSLRLASLVNDILDMEKLACGKMHLQLQRVDLVHLAQQALDANAAYAAGFGVSYHLHTECERAEVLGDVDRLMQVFANLLSNAAKFAPNGDQVGVRVLPSAQQWRVEIEDHGRGIEPAFHPHIFGKFAQADATATRHVEGAGLGLHITKTLIEKMHGEIGFSSQQHVRTIFWFSLKALPPEVPPEQTAQ